MIKRKKTSFFPNYAVPPGKTLFETLRTLGMTQAELADRMGRPKKTINEIISGKTAITAETALQFERVFGAPASFWNNLERNYRETLARLKEDKQLCLQKEWIKRFPIAAMIKEKWLSKEESPIKMVKALLNFFGVAGIEEWQKIWQSPLAIYRASSVFQGNPYAIAAWLREGEIEAGQEKCAPFAEDAFKESLKKIRLITSEPPNIFEPEMKKLCAQAGIAVVFVPELPGTHVYGATRWLNSTKALIQLSLRGKSDDFLWFTFFHEAGHVLLHGKREAFIESKKNRGEKSAEKEDEADKFAREFLISSKKLENFIGKGDFSLAAIKRFADFSKIAPGIVVGRLQHDRHIHFSEGNSLKRTFRFAA